MDRDPTQVDYAASELRYNRFMEAAYHSALATLALPPGSRGLDVGCGPGGLLPLLAGAVGDGGRITGLDLSSPHLAAAERLVAEHDLAGWVVLRQADLREQLPFADATFDWAWSADVLWPTSFADPIATVRELARVTRPGGTVTLFFISASRGLILPGEPGLEHRVLRAAGERWARALHPTLHPETAGAWLRAVGLRPLGTTAHLAQHRAPLDEAALGYLEGYLLPDYRALTRDEAARAGMTPAEWDRWRTLSDPVSPDYALAQPGYYCYQVGTLTVGRVPASDGVRGAR